MINNINNVNKEQFKFYKFTDRQINNLMNFLDRIHDYKNGLQDHSAMSEILYSIQNPILTPMGQNQDNKNDTEIKDNKKENK